MNLLEQVKHENKIVQDWLLFYDERKEAYLRKREEILNSTPVFTGSGSIKTNKYSDPTGRKAVNLAELQELEKWLEVVDYIEKELPLNYRVLLQVRRKYRYLYSWRLPAQFEYARLMSQETGKPEEDVYIEVDRMWDMWEKIVNLTARVAAKKGLLK